MGNYYGKDNRRAVYLDFVSEYACGDCWTLCDTREFKSRMFRLALIHICVSKYRDVTDPVGFIDMESFFLGYQLQCWRSVGDEL